jgi:hypothetical protein
VQVWAEVQENQARAPYHPIGYEFMPAKGPAVCKPPCLR